MEKAKQNQKAIERFKNFTSTKNSRKVLFKMYFFSDQGKILSREDQEEIFFLYNLLEDIE